MTDEPDKCKICGEEMHWDGDCPHCDHNEPPADYSEHPVSVTEVRADRSGNAKDWTARDALISCLRAIDSGELVADEIAIIVSEKFPNGDSHYKYYQRTVSTQSLLGLYSIAEHDINVQERK